jgi:hypothetical protein
MKKMFLIIMFIFTIPVMSQIHYNRVKMGVDYAFLGRGDASSSLFNLEYNRNLYGNLSFRGKIGYGISGNKDYTSAYNDYSYSFNEYYINNKLANGPNDYLRTFFDAEIGLEFAFLNTDYTSLSIFSGLAYMSDSGPLSGGRTEYYDQNTDTFIVSGHLSHNNTHDFGGVIGFRFLIDLAQNMNLDISASRVVVEHSGSLNCGIGIGMGF